MYNANKFLFAFEWILGQARDGYVSYEHSKVLAMLLHSVKYCYDSVNLQREPGLWKDSYQPEEGKPPVQGMGFERTLQESGYGWLLPKVD
jgi:hypothetical protein